MREAYTNQEAFDTAARHLLTQHARAYVLGRGCCYRTRDGLKCAVGALIEDADAADLAKAGANHAEVDTLQVHGLVPIYLRGVSLELLKSLQLIHDGDEPPAWKQLLGQLAVNWKLDPKVLEEFPG